MWRALLVLIAACGLASAQSTSGSQHFVVVIVANLAPDFDPQGRGVQVSAEECVEDLLYKPGKVIPNEPWYKFGRDAITIIESGPGTKSTEAQSAAKGNWKAVDFDYARPITRTAIRLREPRFSQLRHPSDRVHFLETSQVLDAAHSLWAGTQHPFNSTHLILLDETSNRTATPSGSVAQIPATTAAHFQEIENKYRLVNRKAIATFPYSPGVGFRVETADIVEGQGAPLQRSAPAQSPNPAMALMAIVLWLGKVAFVLGIVALARWIFFQQRVARHFQLWVPGYAAAFELPAMSQSTPVQSRARLPRYSGEPAAHLQLPHRLIRYLFYSNAVLKWDPKLGVEGVPLAAKEYRLTRLPRFVTFLWVERPTDEGKFDICIERRRMLGGTDEIPIEISFLALPPQPQVTQSST